VPSQAGSQSRPARAKGMLVERIYKQMIEEVAKGASHIDQLRQFMTLLLTELDTYAMIYPDLKQWFATVYERLWRLKFPDIPPPVVGEDDTATEAYAKALQALRDNWEKLIPKIAPLEGAAYSEVDVEGLVEREALLFMDSVLRTVYRSFGII
jgi:hypothetical protein